jgi:hypothetical protein
MLEAVNHGPRFTISLKRSTQNLQLSTSRRPITPSFAPRTWLFDRFVPIASLRAAKKTPSPAALSESVNAKSRPSERLFFFAL